MYAIRFVWAAITVEVPGQTIHNKKALPESFIQVNNVSLFGNMGTNIESFPSGKQCIFHLETCMQILNILNHYIQIASNLAIRKHVCEKVYLDRNHNLDTRPDNT